MPGTIIERCSEVVQLAPGGSAVGPVPCPCPLVTLPQVSCRGNFAGPTGYHERPRVRSAPSSRTPRMAPPVPRTDPPNGASGADDASGACAPWKAK